MAAAVGVESTVEEIGDWLRTMEAALGDDTEGIAELFEENGVDGALLQTLSAEELHVLVGISDEAQVAAIIEARDAAFADAARSEMLSGGGDNNCAAAQGAEGEPEPEPPARKHPPMYRAVKRRDVALLQQMLAEGIDPNHPAEATAQALGMGQQGGRRSPLHFAGIYRLHEIMSLLLAHGAEVDLLDANGWSALHYVALNGDADAAEILLAAGADPGLSIMQGGGMGETAAAFARRHGQIRFAETVERHVAAAAAEPA